MNLKTCGTLFLLVSLLLCACGIQPPAPAPPAHKAGPGAKAADDSQPVPATRLLINDNPLDVEVAGTPKTRSLGLMYRESLAPDSGMLFIFDSPQALSFWMKNTLIPLDIAFADDAGVIVDIQRMAPHTTTSHRSARPARYAVEANLGWFAAAGVRVGDTIRNIPGLPGP